MPWKVVAGEQEQLQLEADRERVGRRVTAFGQRPVEDLQEPHEALEDARLRLGLGVQLQHRLGADQRDAERVRPRAGRGVGRDDVRARDGVELAPTLVQHERRPGERLEPAAEPRRRLAHPLCDRVHASALGGIEVQHAVGLGEPHRPQDDRIRAVRTSHPASV
jgi:hypothetical protein